MKPEGARQRAGFSYFFKKSEMSIPASRTMARSVPSAISRAWVGKGDFEARDGVPPDFMTTWTGAVKGEPQGAQLAGHLAILEPRKATH